MPEEKVIQNEFAYLNSNGFSQEGYAQYCGKCGVMGRKSTQWNLSHPKPFLVRCMFL